VVVFVSSSAALVQRSNLQGELHTKLRVWEGSVRDRYSAGFQRIRGPLFWFEEALGVPADPTRCLRAGLPPRWTTVAGEGRSVADLLECAAAKDRTRGARAQGSVLAPIRKTLQEAISRVQAAGDPEVQPSASSRLQGRFPKGESKLVSLSSEARWSSFLWAKYPPSSENRS
jgi:hypothetical protein